MVYMVNISGVVHIGQAYNQPSIRVAVNSVPEKQGCRESDPLTGTEAPPKLFEIIREAKNVLL